MVSGIRYWLVVPTSLAPENIASPQRREPSELERKPSPRLFFIESLHSDESFPKTVCVSVSPGKYKK